MRWGSQLIGGRDNVQAFPIAATRIGPIRFATMLLASLAVGFLIGERYLPRLDGGDLSTVKMTYEQIRRERKSGLLKKTVVSSRAETREEIAPRPLPPAGTPSSRAAVALANFYAALRGLDDGSRSEPVTILHLGDSHIASDRFTGDMRELLQVRFGDAGRGMMMPGFPFGYYRARGASFAKSSGWTAYNSLNKGDGPYGISGVKLTTSNRGAWLSLTSRDGAFEWAEVALLTGPGQGSVEIAVDRTTTTVQTRSPERGMVYERIPVKGTKLKLSAMGDGAVTVLSWTVGVERPGVRYVNFGIPSATADITRQWDDRLVAADLKRLSPELIILGYGTNEGFNDGLNQNAYQRRIEGLIKKLQRMAPKADFLIIGPPDGARFPRALRGRVKMASLTGMGCHALAAEEKESYSRLLRAGDGRLARWHPPPKLSAVRVALKRAAKSVGADFWDWSQVMGGACGIHEWVESEPRLATSDHVHITAAGSKRSAEALYTELMAGFTAHRMVAQR